MEILPSETTDSSENRNKKVDYDEIDIDEALNVTGLCGRFQCVVQIVIVYTAITLGYQFVLPYFIGKEAAWKCTRNDTSSFCQEYFGEIISSDDHRFSHRCRLRREEWNYATRKEYSFVTEFDLICKKASIAALANGVYYLGGAAVIFSGMAADNYGRKLVLLLCLLFTTALSLGSAYVKTAGELTGIRFFLGCFCSAAYSTAYVYLMEMISPSYRSLASNIFSLGFPMSEWLIDVLAVYSKTWRNLHLYASFPPILAMIVVVPLLPKSPRWLLAKERRSEAENVIQRINKCNGNADTDIHLKIPERVSHEKRYTICDLFRNRKVLFLTLSVGLIWFASSIAFYVISFESSNLGGNMYQAFALSALAELPSKLLATFACNRFGRKKTTLVSLGLAGLFAGSTTLVPRSYTYRYACNISLLMIAKCSADTCMMALFLWTFELFPTVLRLQGWGVSILFENVGKFSVPFLTSVFHAINPIIPYVVVMLLSLLAAAGGFILPETNKKPTRETYQDFFHSDNHTVNGKVNEGLATDEAQEEV